jgi:hypothetical protein
MGLECVFPIWFAQCSHVWFTLPMPCSDHDVLLKATAQHGRWETAYGLPVRVQLLPATTRSSTKVVSRSIPISDAGGQCETKQHLSWMRRRMVAAHYKRNSLLNCWNSSSDISGYHAEFHKGHSTVRAWQGHGMCELTARHGRGTAWAWLAMCKSALRGLKATCVSSKRCHECCPCMHMLFKSLAGWNWHKEVLFVIFYKICFSVCSTSTLLPYSCMFCARYRSDHHINERHWVTSGESTTSHKSKPIIL